MTTPTVEDIARAIVGPREEVPVGSPYTLAELRQTRWDMATVGERNDAIWAARAVHRLFSERRALQRLYASATEKLRDTSCLASNPPQNAAVWDIRNEIVKEIKASEKPEEPSRKAGLLEAMELVNNMRMSEAGIFNDPKYAGQRGCDRSDALYDVFQAIRKIAA